MHCKDAFIFGSHCAESDLVRQGRPVNETKPGDIEQDIEILREESVFLYSDSLPAIKKMVHRCVPFVPYHVQPIGLGCPKETMASASERTPWPKVTPSQVR